MPESSPAWMAHRQGKLCIFLMMGKTNSESNLKILHASLILRTQLVGVNEAGCSITPLDGPLFHAVIYHGDIDGWRKDIEAGAKGMGLLLAQIEGDQFVITDGRSIPLSECKIEFS